MAFGASGAKNTANTGGSLSQSVGSGFDGDYDDVSYGEDEATESSFSWDNAGKVGAAALGGLGEGLSSPQQSISYDRGNREITAPGIKKDLSYYRAGSGLLGLPFIGALRKREERLQDDINEYNEVLQGKYDKQKKLDDEYNDASFERQRQMMDLNEKSLDFNSRIGAAKRAIQKQREGLSKIAGVTKKFRDAGIKEDSFEDFKISRWRS